MTTKTLTALLERLERAGGALKNDESVCGTWLFFPAGGRELITAVGVLSEPNAAVLLGWAIQQIEAQGYWRDVYTYPDDGSVIVKTDQGNGVFERQTQAPTELEATLTCLAEILEAQR